MINSLLACTLQTWNEVFALLANIATCITALSVFSALVVYIKNRISKKSFRVTFLIKEIYRWSKNYCVEGNIIFENLTDKEFSIVSSFLCLDSKEYPISNQPIPNQDFEPLVDIYLISHASASFQPIYVITDLDLSVKPASIKVKTTVGEFCYRIDVRELRNKIKNFQK